MLREAGFDVADDAHVVPDDAGAIAALLVALADAGHRLILTTGGHGAVTDGCDPGRHTSRDRARGTGLAELMRAAGLASTPMASLSGGVVGTRGRTLIANLPGSPRGARRVARARCLPVLRHALEQLAGADH